MKAVKIFCLLLLTIPALWAGPILLLTNTEGQSFEAELLSANDNSIKIRRSSDKKIFTVPLSTFDEATLLSIEKGRKVLANTYPKYELDVSIGKIKKDDGFFIEKQKISATVKIGNTHRTLASPELSCRFFFLGQSQSNKDRYQILATREFKVSPDPDKTVEVELRPFTGDEEDSWGYYEYDGYILILYKKDNTVADFKTTNSRYRQAIDLNVGILDRYRTIKAGTMVGENLLPAGERGGGQGDVISIEE